MQASEGIAHRCGKVVVASAFGLVTLAALSGCTRLEIKFGSRVPLATLPVSSMEASLPQNPAIAPGGKSPLVVKFTTPDGKVWVTEGQGNGKILWSDLVVTPTVVTVNKKGVLSLARDPRVSDGKTGHVTITAPSHPDLRAELDIPLRYNIRYQANYSGSNGSNGMDGSNGLSGSDGLPGSMDPDHPSAGGNGSDGANGGDGQSGGNGGDAPSIQVWLTPHPGPQQLIEAGVLAAGRKERFYLIDPQGGSLTVLADGGDAGKGGRGGSAGRGGSGGIGQPSGMSGHDGLAGHDGSNGFAGRGGQITVTYDPQVAPWLNILHMSSSGGPKPIFQEKPVPPLW
jgi:hypothetical protein